ncbi:MAG: AmmeMemoRadiSam system protein A [Thermoanaerobaculia bacterium]
MLDPTDRELLILIARRSIESALEGRPIDWPEITESLERPSGAFVTLTIDGELRGCIGTIFPVTPLFQAVADNARHAAFGDPRFPHLRADEYPAVAIEISVMGPVTRVNDISEIVLGRDGLIYSRGSRKGLLLPQVATEYGWDLQSFLSHTCLKAGLPADSWRSGGGILEKFSAEVFGEVVHVK